MVNAICIIYYMTGQRNTFRNIPEWKFRFGYSVCEPIGWIAETGSDTCASAPLDLDILKIRSEAARFCSATCAIDRSISASKRQPTANVNYHALFLFIDAREPHRHRVSVIKNVFLARLCFLKEKHLKIGRKKTK